MSPGMSDKELIAELAESLKWAMDFVPAPLGPRTAVNRGTRRKYHRAKRALKQAGRS